MPTDAKRAAVAQLKDDLSRSHATLVADYRGLTVSDIGAVRRVLREQGVTYRVVKNRLAKIAAQEAGRSELVDLLDGPSSLAMGGQDEVVLARTFLDAVRPYRTVVIRGGVIGDRRIDAASITRLATLPPRDVLLAQLAGGIASPLATLASLLAAPLRNLAYALQQVADQKTRQAPEAPTAPEPAEATEDPTTAETTTPEEASTTAEPDQSPDADQSGEAPATSEADQTAEAPTTGDADQTSEAEQAPASEQTEEVSTTAEAEAAPDAEQPPESEQAPEAEQA